MRGANISPGLRIIILILLNIILITAGLFLLNWLDIFDFRDFSGPLAELLGLQQRTTLENVEDPMLLENVRYQMKLEALSLRQEELDQEKEQFETQKQELQEMMDQMQEKQESFKIEQNSFNQQQKAYDDERRNLEQLSEYLVGMPPQEAVNIMLAKEDIDIVKILRVTEEMAQASGSPSLVAYWLSLMPADRAAVLTRKMTKQPLE